MTSFDLQGVNVLVTGASSGLGASFVKLLAGQGARVIAGARRLDRLEALCAEIDATGGSALPVELDVTDQDSVARAFDTAQQEYGVVTVLVNNAGISRPAFLLDATADDWDAVVDTNLKSVWLVSREAVQRMREAGHSGSVINVASVLASGTTKMLGSYMAAKAGVEHLTRAMALEWAEINVRVNALAPGYFNTEMTGEFLQTGPGQAMVARIPQKRVGGLCRFGGSPAAAGIVCLRLYDRVDNYS